MTFYQSLRCRLRSRANSVNMVLLERIASCIHKSALEQYYEKKILTLCALHIIAWYNDKPSISIHKRSTASGHTRRGYGAGG